MKAFYITSLFLSFVIIVISIVYAVKYRDFQSSTPVKILSPIVDSLTESTERIAVSLFSKDLGDVMKDALDHTDGTFSVVIRNFKTDEYYTFNERKVFPSASLFKLWIMAVTFQQVNDGKIREINVLSDDVIELNERLEIATESAPIKEGEISMKVRDALEKMITVSDNYAAQLLSDRVGAKQIAAFLKQESFTDSAYKSPPTTTALDIAYFFEKLYRRELIDEKTSSRMIDTLKRQQLRDRIPKYLPDTIEIANKTGELGTNKHDAGIVFTPQGDYMIVVLTDTKNPKLAAEQIAILSQKIYEYFTSNNK